MSRINKFSTETEAPFNSPEGGKYFPPWKLSVAEVSEGVGEANALKGQNNSAWGNALRYEVDRHCGLDPQSLCLNHDFCDLYDYRDFFITKFHKMAIILNHKNQINHSSDYNKHSN